MQGSMPRHTAVLIGSRLQRVTRLVFAAVVALATQISGAARANVVEFATKPVPDFPFVHFDIKYSGSIFGGPPPASAQQPGSDTARFIGNLHVDLHPPTAEHPFGTIQLL